MELYLSGTRLYTRDRVLYPVKSLPWRRPHSFNAICPQLQTIFTIFVISIYYLNYNLFYIYKIDQLYVITVNREERVKWRGKKGKINYWN
jgi:hypothetical protein